MVAGQWLGLPAELDENHRAYLAHWESKLEEPPQDADKKTRSAYRRTAIRALRAMANVTTPAQALAHVATGDLQAAGELVEWFDPQKVVTPVDADKTLPSPPAADEVSPEAATAAEQAATAEAPEDGPSELSDYTKGEADDSPFDDLIGDEPDDPADAFEMEPTEAYAPGF